MILRDQSSSLNSVITVLLLSLSFALLQPSDIVWECNFEDQTDDCFQPPSREMFWRKVTADSDACSNKNDHTYQNQTSHYWCLPLHSNDGESRKCSLLGQTPLEEGHVFCVSFWYYYFEEKQIKVESGVDQNNKFTGYWQQSTNQGERWNFAEYSVNTSSSGAYVRFEGRQTASGTGFFAIDDVKVTNGACLITSTTTTPTTTSEPTTTILTTVPITLETTLEPSTTTLAETTTTTPTTSTLETAVEPSATTTAENTTTTSATSALETPSVEPSTTTPGTSTSPNILPTSIEPTGTAETTTTGGSSSRDDLSLIIGVSVASGCALIAIIVAGFFYWKYKAARQSATTTPPSNIPMGVLSIETLPRREITSNPYAITADQQRPAGQLSKFLDAISSSLRYQARAGDEF